MLSLCENALERHIDAFVEADLEAIMVDYHPEAVLQLPDVTLHGAAAIRDMFTGFFKLKPAGSPIEMQRKETIYMGGNCMSYLCYSMSSDHVEFPLATDTFLFNSSGQIMHQTFAGYNLKDAKQNSQQEASIKRIGWVGLGQMGKAHVNNLLQKCPNRFQFVVWNRSSAAADELSKLGATVANSPKEVVESCDITFVMLSTPAVAREVYSSPEGILTAVQQGKSIIECASLDAETMEDIHRWVSEKQGRFVASPVLGHSNMAKDATCQLVCGGDKSLFDEAAPMLDAIAKNKVWLGSNVGAPANMKLIINGLLANITCSISEAVAICDKSKLNREALKNLISNHAMNSPLLQLCMKMIFSEDHPSLFKLEHMRKDVTLCAAFANNLGQPSVMCEGARCLYDNAMKEGYESLNWTGVHKSIVKHE